MPSTIPILDYSKRNDPSWVHRLSAACKEWGCFQLVSHPFSHLQTTHLHASMKQFFSLPKQDKYAIDRTEKNPWGYYDRELTKNIRDWKEILDIGPPANNGPFMGAKPQWPASMPDLRNQLEEYFRGCEELSLFLLNKLAESLNTPTDVFTEGFETEASSFLRLNYYPVCEEPDHHLGISPHSDSGALTVLFADQQPGLQFGMKIIDILSFPSQMPYWSSSAISPKYGLTMYTPRHCIASLPTKMLRDTAHLSFLTRVMTTPMLPC